MKNSKRVILVILLIVVCLLMSVGGYRYGLLFMEYQKCGLSQEEKDEYLKKITENNDYIIESKTYSQGVADYAAIINFKDEFFKKTVKEQYEIILPLYEKLADEVRYQSMIIRNKDDRSVYEFRKHYNYEAEEAEDTLREIFYIFALDKEINMYELNHGEFDLNSINNDEVLVGLKHWDTYLDANERKEKEKRLAREQQRERERKDALWGADPEIGMDADEVRWSSWSYPNKVNKTTTKYGVREQWVYPNNKYIYFEDGRVTSIQE